MNAIGGCCGSSPEHIAAIREMALGYPPRQLHSVPAHLRLSGLEPLNYAPDEGNMRSTFINIGERCNVAGSIIYKKAIVAGDYDKAASIALSQVGAGWQRRLVISSSVREKNPSKLALALALCNFCRLARERMCWTSIWTTA